MEPTRPIRVLRFILSFRLDSVALRFSLTSVLILSSRLSETVGVAVAVCDVLIVGVIAEGVATLVAARVDDGKIKSEEMTESVDKAFFIVVILE